MNYKRTVEDFEMCGRKGKNGPYNFPYISDCVGSTFTGPCDDPAAPVPCGDGTCTTDYIHCLKSMVLWKKRQKGARSDVLRRRENAIRRIAETGEWEYGESGARIGDHDG